MSSLGLLLHLAVAMAVVIGVMWVAARLLAKRTGGRPGRPGGSVEVLARRGLGRNSSVAVVRAGGHTLVVGVTDTQISLLAEADPSALGQDDGESGTLDLGAQGPSTARMQLFDSIRERTVRR